MYTYRVYTSTSTKQILSSQVRAQAPRNHVDADLTSLHDGRRKDAGGEKVERMDNAGQTRMPRRQGGGKIFRFNFKVIFFGHDAMVCHVLSCHVVSCLWSATWENER